jgi:hypothetical protein
MHATCPPQLIGLALLTAHVRQLHPGPIPIVHGRWLSGRVLADQGGGPAGGRGLLVWHLVGRGPLLQRDTLSEPLPAPHEARARPDRLQLRLSNGIQDAPAGYGHREIRRICARSVSPCDVGYKVLPWDTADLYQVSISL